MDPQDRKRARERDRVIGLAANSISLAHFTPESVDQFLTEVSHLADDVANLAGPSPWTPERRRHLKGSLNAPSGDDKGPFNFAALTHVNVIRALVAADPSNVRDTAALMRLVAAAEGLDEMKLNLLRIAARWNYAMALGRSLVLVDADDAPELQPVRDNEEMPVTRVTTDDHGLAITFANGNRIPGGYRPAEGPLPVESAEDNVVTSDNEQDEGAGDKQPSGDSHRREPEDELPGPFGGDDTDEDAEVPTIASLSPTRA